MKIRTLYIDNEPVKSMKIDGKAVAFTATAAGYLCFTAEQAGSTVKLTQTGSPNPVLLQTSSDAKQWNNYTIGDDIILTNVGDKIYFKAMGVNDTFSTNRTDYYKFVMTGKIAASGNVNSLLNEDQEAARTMSLAGKSYCYNFMFHSCKSLTTAPELPATTIADYCYQFMFYNCSLLTTVPELPATTLASNCYTNMFFGCISLTTAQTILPATTLAYSCYSNMFQGCSSLTTAPAILATTLANYCCLSMFQGCSSLTTAPVLQATTLATSCYFNMFYGCSKLNYVKVKFTNWTPTNATSTWLPNNTGTFECPWDLITNTSTRSTSTVPSNWTMVAEV